MSAFRAVWVDEGNDADVAKLARHGIDSPYFSVRDPSVTATYLQEVFEEGFTPGVYAAWNWYGGDGRKFAEQVDWELKRIGWLGNPPVCLDIETHDVGYILAALKRWRELRPRRTTDMTLEGYQGGLFSPAQVLLVSSRVRYTVPQAYTGTMQAFDAVDVAADLAFHSFPPRAVKIFYDAAQLPVAWQGYAFTQGRLP